ncbi:uncharacterized protein LOC129587396 [Paramacrobiotus metropolitanus]|uniref:uncharacterized protein LOC129587396 n=1 Tax=Paramacrobiotus metropolitanus TaxID=2943436 RepID=UPI002445E5E3|nr:uncharacterized protein LOC129587396 [Paramacrobiotus metropolitanus]
MSNQDLVEQILDDHKEMRAFIDKIQQTCPSQPEEATKWLHQLVWEVARHSVAEELILYPLMETELGAVGKNLADSSRADHQRTKDDLQFLENKTLADPAAVARYRQMADELIVHLKKEEDEDLTQVRLNVGQDKLLQAGKEFKRTKFFAPTRPHPENSMDPRFETPYSLLVAPLDKLRDLFRSFPDRDLVEKVEAEATGHS